MPRGFYYNIYLDFSISFVISLLTSIFKNVNILVFTLFLILNNFMEKTYKNKNLSVFLLSISILTFILFWQVFLQNKIPFNANLLASFYNPWAQERFTGWENGIPNKPTAKDDIWIFYPQRTFTTSMLKNLDIPFWNPYSFSGNYHFGLSETAVFYPLNFLFLIFSQIDVWVFLIFIEPIIAGIGMYLFLKRIILNEKSAILGALSFAFSGIVIVRAVEGLSVGHTLIWMPYVFWGIESFFKTKKIRFLWVILISLSLSILAGWFQFTFYIFIFAFLYSLFKLFFDSKESSFKFLIITPFLALPLITLFHTIPALTVFLESPRSAIEGRLFSFQHLVPVIHIFTLIIPDFWGNPAVYNYFGKSDYKDSIMFIGVIPMIFSLIAILKQKSRKELFFLASIVISFIFGVDNPISRLIVRSSLPIFSSFLPDRIFLVSTFSFSILSASGLDYILNKKINITHKVIKKIFIFILIFVILLFSFLTLKIMQDPSILNKIDKAGINTSTDAIQFKNSIIPLIFLIITTSIFFIFRNRYSAKTFFLITIFFLFIQSFLFAQKYIPFSNRQFLYPAHPVFTYLKKHQKLDRFMSIGYGHIVPSIPLQFGLYSPEGIGSMYIRRYGELIRYTKFEDYGIPDKIAFDLEIYPKEVFYPKNKRLLRFFELTNVKYIVVDKKSLEESKLTPETNDFNLVWENKKWKIYKYKKSIPRIFASSNFEIIPEKEKILKTLFNDIFNPNKIILEENPGFDPKNYQEDVKIMKYSPNRIELQILANYPALVYLSDNYTKSFKVFIDGKEGKILRANYTFRAIPIPKGKHDVVMIYDGRLVFIGFLIAAGIIIVAIFLSLMVRKRINR